MNDNAHDQTDTHTNTNKHTRNEATNQRKRKQAAHLTAVELQREFIASTLQRHALDARHNAAVVTIVQCCTLLAELPCRIGACTQKSAEA